MRNKTCLYLFLLACITSTAVAQQSPAAFVRPFTIVHINGENGPTAALEKDLTKGVGLIEKFFGSPFPKRFIVNIYPSRYELDRQWQRDWSDPDFKSQCWMVASGIATRIDLLSPVTWVNEACEHVASDSVKTRQLIIHEMVHVYHGQQNPSPDFSAVKGIDWLVEGLATYVSGQLTAKRRDEIKTLHHEKKIPVSLDEFWKGRSKYGLSGALVEYVDKQYGRDTLIVLLQLTTLTQVLQALKISEPQLINNFSQSLK
jgi:hypothetical protein